MLELKLSDRTKTIVEANVGLKFDEIVNLSFDEELKFITKQKGAPIVFSKVRNSRKMGRGNPLLARKKIRTMEDVDKKMARMK